MRTSQSPAYALHAQLLLFQEALNLLPSPAVLGTQPGQDEIRHLYAKQARVQPSRQPLLLHFFPGISCQRLLLFVDFALHLAQPGGVVVPNLQQPRDLGVVALDKLCQGADPDGRVRRQ